MMNDFTTARRLVAATSLVAACLTFAATSGAAMAGAAAPATASNSVTVLHTDLQVDPIAKYTVTVKCDLVKIGTGTVGKITGTGTGKTKPAAVAAAKKDADNSVPKDHYKRHCKEI
jgi:hypothetical protein